MKFLAAFRWPHITAVKPQPLLVLLSGVVFVVIGMRGYPAFIAVGLMFLVIAYRGFTCK